MDSPGGTSGKEPANAGDLRDADSIPGLGRSSGGGRGNPLQYSHLENPMNRGAWQATVHGVSRVRHDIVTKPTNQSTDVHSNYSEPTSVVSWGQVLGAIRRARCNQFITVS